MNDDEILAHLAASNIEPHHLVGFLQLAEIEFPDDPAVAVRDLAEACDVDVEVMLAWFHSDADFDEYIAETPVAQKMRAEEEREGERTRTRLRDHYHPEGEGRDDTAD